MLDGDIAHHDPHGGGVIGEGDTPWMTAGSDIGYDEVPTEAFTRTGGRSHSVQLWVNLPAALKMTPSRDQAIDADHVTLATSADGDALVRLIAGELAGQHDPGAMDSIPAAHLAP